MDPEEPTPPTPNPPLQPWAPPPDGRAGGRGSGAPAAPDPATEFFRGTRPGDLGIGDAVSTGFRVLARPAFLLPVLIVSTLVTVTSLIAFGPLVSERLTLDPAAVEERLPLLISSAIVAVIGSLLAATYGQVWLVAATSGPEPSLREALGRTGDRWLAVLGSGLLVGLLIGVVSLPVVLLAVAAGGAAVPVLLLIMAPLFIYLGSRLSLATWLAADGRGPVDSVRQSWELANGQILRIVGWNVAFGLVFAVVGAVLEIPLERLTVGTAIVEGITLAAGFGAGIALYRKVQAEAPDVEARARL